MIVMADPIHSDQSMHGCSFLDAVPDLNGLRLRHKVLCCLLSGIFADSTAPPADFVDRMRLLVKDLQGMLVILQELPKSQRQDIACKH